MTTKVTTEGPEAEALATTIQDSLTQQGYSTNRAGPTEITVWGEARKPGAPGDYSDVGNLPGNSAGGDGGGE